MYTLPIYDETHGIKIYVLNFIRRHGIDGNGMFTRGAYVRRVLKKKYNATYPDVHAKDFKYKIENLNLIFESDIDRTTFLLRWS